MLKVLVCRLLMPAAVLVLCSCGGNSGNSSDSQVVADTANKSLEELNKKILDDPNNAALYHARAKQHIERKDLEAALKDMERALKLDSSKVVYYHTMSDIYFFGNRTGESKKTLEKLVALDPNDVDALLKLAELHAYVDKNQESIDYINKALKIDQHNAKGYFLKGMNFKRLGDTAKAISSMQTAVEQDQQYYAAYVQLGLLCAAQKNALALDYYNNALRISPQSSEVLYNKAKFMQDMGDYKNAVSVYEQLLKIEPSNKFAVYNLGAIVLVEKKDFKTALGYFDKAIQIDPKYAEAYFARGACYQELGDKKKALEDYKLALQMDPQYTAAAEAVSSLQR